MCLRIMFHFKNYVGIKIFNLLFHFGLLYFIYYLLNKLYLLPFIFDKMVKQREVIGFEMTDWCKSR